MTWCDMVMTTGLIVELSYANLIYTPYVYGLVKPLHSRYRIEMDKDYFLWA